MSPFAYGGPSCSTNLGRPLEAWRILSYSFFSCHCLTHCGSRLARSPRIGNGVSVMLTGYLLWGLPAGLLGLSLDMCFLCMYRENQTHRYRICAPSNSVGRRFGKRTACGEKGASLLGIHCDGAGPRRQIRIFFLVAKFIQVFEAVEFAVVLQVV